MSAPTVVRSCAACGGVHRAAVPKAAVAYPTPPADVGKRLACSDNALLTPHFELLTGIDAESRLGRQRLFRIPTDGDHAFDREPRTRGDVARNGDLVPILFQRVEHLGQGRDLHVCARRALVRRVEALARVFAPETDR